MLQWQHVWIPLAIIAVGLLVMLGTFIVVGHFGVKRDPPNIV